jgi:tetratricopeptide (TPR) repeat protein
MYSPFVKFSRNLCLAATLLALGLPLSAQTESARDYQFDDDTIEAINKYQEESKLPNKDYNKLLNILNTRLASLKNQDSYDAAMLLQFIAKTYIEKNEFPKAIEPMEKGLIISDRHSPTFLDERTTAEVNYYLAQLYYQESTATKDAKKLAQIYEKAEGFIDRWTKVAPKVTEDGLNFYASLLYSRATLDDKNLDKDRLHRALDLIDRCMKMNIRPKDSLYLLKLVTLQQLDRYAESADIFEILLRNKPDNATYWKQLASLYLNLNQPIRAINTLERAQSHGLLLTPSDNYNVIGLYFNENQFETTAELLEKGLLNGGIENTDKNWELLAYSYQQLNRDFKAIDAYKRAMKQFPKSGQFDYLISQIYYNMQRLEDAFAHLQASVSKGAGNKPHQTYVFMAYIAFELKKLDIALDAANKAIAIPEGVKEGTRMKKAIEEAIEDRKAKLESMST